MIFARYSNVRDADESAIADEIERACLPFNKPVDHVQKLRVSLMNAMWEDVGVMRTEMGLKHGLDRIGSVSNDLMSVGVASDNLAFNLTWHDWLNMRSLCEVSQVIAGAALSRENSRGAHYREDFPEQGELETSYYTVASQKAGRLAIEREAVQFTIVHPGETILPDDEPVTLVEAAE